MNRNYIEAIIPEVFESLADSFRNTTGRMSAFNIQDRIQRVFSTWLDWSIFPSTYIFGLEGVFYMSENEMQSMLKYIDDHLETFLLPLLCWD